MFLCIAFPFPTKKGDYGMDKKKNVKAVIGVIAVLVCGMIYITANYRRDSGGIIAEQSADAGDSGEEAFREGAAKAGEEPVSDKVYIHICGEVKKPGVYTFSVPPRLVEVIEHAGGFTKKADRSAVNLAESVPDGSRITILSRKKEKTKEKSHGATSEGEDRININTASREELMTLNGIGESKASQIISYRETNGLFKKIDDIMNISGIKEGVFSKIKDHIIVS